MAIILDGKKASKDLKEEVRLSLDQYYKKGAPKCNLAIIMVGDNPASEIYVRNKAKACEAIGIGGQLIKLSEKITQEELEKYIIAVSKDPKVHGVMVQLPLPPHLDADRATELVPPEKDVDGFTTANLGKLIIGNQGFLSCTPGGIIYLLKNHKIVLAGKNVVIVGRSKIVGKPLALALLNENCTVTVCHSKTKNLAKSNLRCDTRLRGDVNDMRDTDGRIKRCRPIPQDEINLNEAMSEADQNDGCKQTALFISTPRATRGENTNH